LPIAYLQQQAQQLHDLIFDNLDLDLDLTLKALASLQTLLFYHGSLGI
jgi:hypothetical protein